MSHPTIEPLFVPSAPCARDYKQWAELEDQLDSVISHRASQRRKQEAALPMVQNYCARCPITAECYAKALNGDHRGEKTEFTGIAGGALFHEGEVSVPFAVLVDRRTA